MANFVSWRPKKFAEEDIKNWKVGKFTYTRDGRESRKAFWVFDLDQKYRPSMDDPEHILIALDYGGDVAKFFAAKENQINFEQTAAISELEREWKALKTKFGENEGLNGMEKNFHGEAKHPCKVIVKNNEPGAYGIGSQLRAQFPVKIRTATTSEYLSALGLGPKGKLDKKWAVEAKYKF